MNTTQLKEYFSDLASPRFICFNPETGKFFVFVTNVELPLYAVCIEMEDQVDEEVYSMYRINENLIAKNENFNVEDVREKIDQIHRLAGEDLCLVVDNLLIFKRKKEIEAYYVKSFIDEAKLYLIKKQREMHSKGNLVKTLSWEKQQILGDLFEKFKDNEFDLNDIKEKFINKLLHQKNFLDRLEHDKNFKEMYLIKNKQETEFLTIELYLNYFQKSMLRNEEKLKDVHKQLKYNFTH